MKVNFDIINYHAIEIEGRQIDLHNDCDFHSFDYNIADREIKLYWNKSSGDWVCGKSRNGKIRKLILW